jgi:quercetin dioxygenase-like cupin family protein
LPERPSRAEEQSVDGGTAQVQAIPGDNGTTGAKIKKDNAMKNAYWLFGTRLSVLADRTITGGRYDLIEGWVPPGTQGPLHRHSAYSEQLYVLDGEFTVWTSGRKAVLRPGDDLFIPAGTPHVVAATGDVPGRALVVASPSGFARLITEAGVPDEGGGVPPSAAPDLDVFFRVCAELGDEILGPPGTLPDEAEIQKSRRDRPGSPGRRR